MNKCDGAEYTGAYVGGQDYSNRKPLMNEDRRKVLDLLEVICELDTGIYSVSAVLRAVCPSYNGMHLTDNQCIPLLEQRIKLLLERRQDVD